MSSSLPPRTWSLASDLRSAIRSRQPASSLTLLRQHSFGLFFLGNLLSNLGTWFHDVAAAILVFQLTGSATMVGGVAVSSYGTSLLFAPLAGQLADRIDRRRLLLGNQLVQATAAAMLAAWVAVGLGNAWIVLGLWAVIGVGRSLNSTTQNALIPSVVERADLAPALALHAATYSVARALGPLVGAVVVATLGASTAFGINAATFALYAAVLPFVRVSPQPVRELGRAGGFQDSWCREEVHAVPGWGLTL